jgi:hypothetical protein
MEETPQSVPDTSPSLFKLVATLGIIIITLLLGLIILLFFQNQQLRQQLSQTQPEVISPTPIETLNWTTPVSSTPSPTVYQAPSPWKKAVFMGLNLCLPPKWAVGNDGIYFERDPAYRQLAAYFQQIPYTGGSKREAYFKFWAYDYPNAATTTKVSELDINGIPVLHMLGPEGEKLVFSVGNNLYQVDFSNWKYVNDVKSRYLSDLYTMLSCSFK